MRIASLLLVTSVVRAAETIFGLSTCGTRCFYQTAKIVGCGDRDFACPCAIFDKTFYPQYSTCLIEGCLGETNDITSNGLKGQVCKQASEGNSTQVTTSRTGPTALVHTSSTSDPHVTQTNMEMTISEPISLQTSSWRLHTRTFSGSAFGTGSGSGVVSGATATATATGDVGSGGEQVGCAVQNVVLAVMGVVMVL